MRTAKFFLFLFILSIPFCSFAQKWERAEKKIEGILEDGNYRKANRKAKKLGKKTTKKLGEINQYAPFVDKAKAAYALQEGQWQDFDAHVTNMLAVSDTVFGKATTAHAYYQYQFAKLWAEAGFIKKAYDTLQLAKATYESNDWPDKVRMAMIVLEGNLLCEMGQYTQALQLIKAENDFMQTYGNAKSGNKKEKKARYAQWAAFINIGAKAWIENGDFAKVDSVLKQYETPFRKNLDKNDWARVNLTLMKAQLFENINNLKAAEKQYKAAYDLSASKRNIEDKRIIPYREALLHAYYRLGKTKDGSKATKTYTEIAKKAFKRRSFHRLEAVFIEGSSAFYEGKNKDAEKKLKTVIEDKSLLPAVHPLKSRANELLYAIYIKDKRFNEAYQNLLEQRESMAFIYGKEGVRFHEKEMMRAAYLFDYTDELKEVGEILSISYDHVLSKELMPQHKHFVPFQNQLAQYYSSLDNYAKALEAMETASEAARMRPNNNSVYGRQLVQFADLLYLTGKLSESTHYLGAADKILTPIRSNQENTQAYAEIMFQKARMMGLKGDFDQAEKMLNDATKFLRRQKTGKNQENVTSLELLSEVYQSIGQYSEAERLLQNAIALSEKNYGMNTRQTLAIQLKLGQLKLTQGDYSQASQIADQVAERATYLYSDHSLKPAAANLLKADISAALGDYTKAAQEMEKAVEIYSKILGDNHLQVAQVYAKLALALLNGNIDRDRAGALLQDAMAIATGQLGKANPTYADLLAYAAYVDIAEQRYPKAFEKLVVAERIWATKSGKKNNANAAMINALLGDVFYNLRDYNKARQHYQKATKLYERYFNDTHPEYVKMLAKISRLEYMEGSEKKAIDLIETVMDRYDRYLQEFFPILSEREKARFWNLIKDDYEFYNSLVLKSVKNYDDKRIAKLFDNAINTKALLLNTSIRLRQNILDSGNEKLIDDFNDWIISKENLAGILAFNPQELAQIGVNKDSLVNVVENLEKSLSQQSDLFNNLTERRNVSWKNVKDALKDNEVAVEMIRFRHFDHTFTDSIIYAALILRNQTKQDKPEIIILEEGNALENKYFNNYRNSIVYKIEDEVSYEKFWKPIEDKIGKTASIYFSPEGIYNQMNLEVIPYPDGRYIADNFNITLINNTKDIYLKSLQQKPVMTTDNNHVMLYGDPQFYADASAVMENKIAPLPGTHAEVQGISHLFESKGWQTNVYLESEANEGQVKAMVNPKVFHIATHGFYDPSPKEDDSFNINQTKAEDNPLLRSGLLLKGAGDIIAQTSRNYNIDNGILTAYEAMNLNLSQTDLVVLSACETGVGELSIGEGVDGLQKAFLVAGAKVLIMSLFKVNDEITKTLMVNFYNRWLETGNIRSSFAEAKNIVRSKHPEPIYWGAFVVFGLE